MSATPSAGFRFRYIFFLKRWPRYFFVRHARFLIVGGDVSYLIA